MWTSPESVRRAAATLLTELAADDLGRVAVSNYDTARLVVLAPWLAGHEARVEHLRLAQQPDGGWGGAGGYGLVPTLAAVGAMLTELDRTGGRGRRRRLARAAVRGAAALHQWLGPDAEPVAGPGTIGADLIVPALLDELRDLAARGGGNPFLADLPDGAVEAMRLPAGTDRRLLDRVRTRLVARDLPQHWWPCLDVLGPAAVANPSVQARAGAVGCSPAATAAWLGGASGDRSALAYLDAVQSRGGGPVPPVIPVTYFETAWVLNNMSVGALSPPVPPRLLLRLETGLTGQGAPLAPGLPVDCDHTAGVLSALLRHGRIHTPDRLLDFRSSGRFAGRPDGDDLPVSTNAHVLEALALYLTHRPAARWRFAAPAQMAAEWLREQQSPDGCWWDGRHASPYYPTAGALQALLLHDGGGYRDTIDRAVAWLRDTQRPDGSWGRWQGTVEETGYAVQALAKAAAVGAAAAILRGYRFLAGQPPDPVHPPLWHGKDLYTPLAVVQAVCLAALHLGSRIGRPPNQRTGDIPTGTGSAPPVPDRDTEA
jgi:hypothetical protein